MKNPLVASLVLATTVGCKRLPEAPAEAGDLFLYTFANFESDGRELEASVPGLEEFILDLDLEGGVSDRAVVPPILTQDDLGGLTMPSGVSAQDQVNVALAARSRHALSDHIELALEDNFVCIDADSTVYAEREFLSDTACFIDGSCELLETTNEIRRETPLLKIWLDIYKDFKVVELEDGRRAMFGRGWTDRVFEGDNQSNTWDQYWVMDVSIEDPNDAGKTLKLYLMWSSASVAGVNDLLFEGTVKGSIDEGITNADNFMSGTMCDNDRNRPYDR